MGTRLRTHHKQRTYLGQALLTIGFLALAAQLLFIVQSMAVLTGKFGDATLGILPTVGMCILSATHALAFHQVDYLPLISRILVLFFAMVTLLAGLALLRPKSRRTQIIELALSPEFEGREMINGSR